MEDMLDSKGSGATTGQGGASDTEKGSEAKTTNEPSKTVKFEDHKRVIDDMLKHKSVMLDVTQKYNDLQAKWEAAEDEKLHAEGDKDKYIASLKTKLSETEGKHKAFVDGFYRSQKYNEVRSAALKMGLRSEAEDDLSLLDLSDVTVEKTDQGRVIVHNAAEKAEWLKSNKPHWFKEAKAANINSGGAGNSGVVPSELTDSYMMELERKDFAKYKSLWPEYVKQVKKRRTA